SPVGEDRRRRREHQAPASWCGSEFKRPFQPINPNCFPAAFTIWRGVSVLTSDKPRRPVPEFSDSSSDFSLEYVRSILRKRSRQTRNVLASVSRAGPV